MLYLFHVNLVVRLVRADPFDPDNAFFKVYRHDKAIGVALHVKDDAISAYDAGRRIRSFHFGTGVPASLLDLVKPSVQRRFYRGLILLSG
jgi:hypothetical protein